MDANHRRVMHKVLFLFDSWLYCSLALHWFLCLSSCLAVQYPQLYPAPVLTSCLRCYLLRLALTKSGNYLMLWLIIFLGNFVIVTTTLQSYTSAPFWSVVLCTFHFVFGIRNMPLYRRQACHHQERKPVLTLWGEPTIVTSTNLDTGLLVINLSLCVFSRNYDTVQVLYTAWLDEPFYDESFPCLSILSIVHLFLSSFHWWGLCLVRSFVVVLV